MKEHLHRQSKHYEVIKYKSDIRLVPALCLIKQAQKQQLLNELYKVICLYTARIDIITIIKIMDVK